MTPARTTAVSGSTGFVRDPLAAIAVPLGPIVLEGRYRLLVGSLWRLGRSRRGRWAFAAGSGALVIALAVLAARHFATTAWPLSGGEPGVLVAAGLLLLLAQGLKAYGWGRLFAPGERPRPLALAAGNGGAALIGVVLPGRFDDATRVAVVRRYPGCPAGVRVLCLSLVMLGLIDSVALAPLALAAAVFPGAGMGVRAGLAVVAAAGVAAAALILALPRVAASRRALRFRLGRWVCPRTTSRRGASEAWALVSGCWLVRAIALFLLLGTLGIGFSFPLALLFLCAGAAAAALPIGPAGAATQVGAGAAALIGSGIGGSQALAVSVAVGTLGVLSGAAILLAAVVWRTGLSLVPSRVKPETTTTKEVFTMSEVQDLQRRRQALETELSGLREQRERAFRANSDVLSLQRVGVTDHSAAEMQAFAGNEISGDSAMSELRRQIELIDDELARDHGGGFGGSWRRIMKWLRK